LLIILFLSMEFTVPGSFNATAECAVNAFTDLAQLRLMRLATVQSSTPLTELLHPEPWQAATQASVCGNGRSRGSGFSAACFFFARDLHRKLGVPIGAVDSSWGGTVIETFMSREAYDSCPHTVCNCSNPDFCCKGETGTGLPPKYDGNSTLWNAMLAPFARLNWAAFVFWQGTSNAYVASNAREYGCNQRALISDIRRKFNAPTLPFLFVQNCE